MSPSRFAVPDTLQALAGAIGSHGESDAVVFFGRGGPQRWSYGHLAEEAEALARALYSHGVGGDDALVIRARNRPEWIVAALAGLRLGARLVPLDTQMDEAALRHAVADSGARMLFTTGAEVNAIREACREADVEIILLEDEDAGDDRCWRSLLAEASTSDDLPSAGADDVAVLFYTSGTTGAPKGVPLTHRNLQFQIRALSEAEIVGPDDRVLVPLPLHHVYPFVVGMLVPLALGLPLLLPSAFTGSQVMKAMQEGQATVMIGVPRLYDALISGLDVRLAQRGRIAGVLFRSLVGASVWARRRLRLRLGRVLLGPLRRRIAPDLRILVSGGAALAPETGWRLEGLGWLVGTGYGLTETAPLLTINAPGSLTFETAGRPIPGVALRIDADAAPERAGAKERSDRQPLGEVLARGAGVFGGYLNLPDKTAEAFADGGWFRTGDLGYLDPEGYLHLAGRRSTMIVTSSGKNVQPETVEEAYLQHPVIAEIAVFERDGKISGLIVPKPGADGSTATDAVRGAVADVSRRLPSYQRLAAYVVTRETIPRTRLGKPRRHLLEGLYEQAQRGEAGAAPATTGPMPLEDMSAEDRALVEDPAARQAWDWLADRYRDRWLTPDTDLGGDLGVDSMEWLNISLELSQRTGADLSEAAIARVRTVRDLLSEVVGGGEAAGTGFSLKDPEAALDERQRRWLRPLGPISRGLSRAIYWLNRRMMRGLFRLSVSGQEHLPANGPFVIAPNHASLLDPAAVAAGLDQRRLQRTYWAGWTGIVFSDPIRRAFARLFQAVPIEQQRGPASSLAFGGAVLKREMALVWFPEGRRSDDGSFQSFMPGLGLLLEYFAVPVVPVVIRGAYDAWPRRHRLPRFRPISVQFLAPLETAQLERQGHGDRPPQRILEALHRHLAESIEQATPVLSSSRFSATSSGERNDKSS